MSASSVTARECGAPTTLADLPVGGAGRVVALEGSPAVVQRLQEMGVTPGTEVLLVRFAPLGDPLEIRVRGYHLSLRKQDARGVRVTPTGPGGTP